MPNGKYVADHGSKPGGVGNRCAKPQIDDGYGCNALKGIAHKHQACSFLAHCPENIGGSRVAASLAVDVYAKGSGHDDSKIDAPDQVGEDDSDDPIHIEKCRADTIADPAPKTR